MRPTLVLALVLLVGSSARGTEFWVRPGGDDTATGTSTASAWASLVHAAGAVDPGDTVHVEDGSYQGFDLRTAGTAGSPITFVAEGSAARITADNGAHARRHQRRGRRLGRASTASSSSDRTRAGIRVAVSPVRHRAPLSHRQQRPLGHLQRLRRRLHDRGQRSVRLASSSTASTSPTAAIGRSSARNLVHDNHANGIHMNGDASEGGDGAHLERPGRAQRDPRQRRRRRLGHQHGRRHRQRGPEQPALRQPRERHQPLPDRRRDRLDTTTWSSTTRSSNAADARWCVNINTGSTGNRRAQQHPATTTTRSTARSRSTRPAARASRRTTTP